jgi:Mg-chelatase subunit ChlD
MKNSFQKLSTLLILSSALTLSTASIAQDSAIVVFDGSGSMNKKIDGKPKFEIAQEVIGNLLKDWNEDIKLGLMVYGHRSKSCDDIEMVIPVGTANSKQFTDAIKKINPKGETPIAESLKQAAEKLNYIESPTTVILISDGEESCNADPCEMAKELEKKGINFTAHVIGFDISSTEQKEALEQLKCVATSTGGEFFEAKNSEALKTALTETAAAIATPVKRKVKISTKKKIVNWKDSFERDELGEDYEIEKFDEDRIAISEGQLLIVTTNPTTNMVKLKQKVSGNFEASIKINVNLTEENWAGIAYYIDNKNYIWLGYYVNDINYGSIDFTKRVKGKASGINYHKKIGNRMIHSSSRKQEEDWFFKIKKQGFNFKAYASIDGKKWTQVGEHALLKKEGQIGFRVGGKGTENPILFDDFRIKPIK